MKITKYTSLERLVENVSGTPNWCLCNVNEDGNYVQIHKPAVCKDYVHELIISGYIPELAKDLFPVHGMSYDAEKYPLMMDKLRVSYTGGSSRHHEILDTNIKVLEDFHDLTDATSPLIIKRVSKQQVVVEADNYWLSTPLHASIFLVVLRAATREPHIPSVEELVSLENIKEILSLPFGVAGFLDLVDNIMDGWKERGLTTKNKYGIHNFGARTFIKKIKENMGVSMKTLGASPYNGLDERIEELVNELSLVFVYGTLKEGRENHRILGDNYTPIRKINTRLPYKMVSLGGFPGLIKDGNTQEIAGEVYIISPEVERRLDRLEGYPNFYGKDTIKIYDMNVKVYTLPYEQYKDHKHVENGTW